MQCLEVHPEVHLEVHPELVADRVLCLMSVGHVEIQQETGL